MHPYLNTWINSVSPHSLDELRALVTRLLPTLSWRHHAIGALQGYVIEDRDPEVRVHIWHQDLVRVDLELDGGRPHDHRFDLRSTVLAGSIGHEELHVAEAFDGEFAEYTVQHARKGEAPLQPTGRKLNASRISGVIRAGNAYTFPARIYHRSFVPEPAVTLVSKYGQTSSPARVLFPDGRNPVFGVHPFDPLEAQKYVTIAQCLLQGIPTR